MCTDHYRKLKRRREIQDQVAVEARIEEKRSYGSEAASFQSDKLIEALERLHERERDILSLHYFSELSIKEVAQSLGIGESAVKMRLSRSREKLLTLMKKM